MDNSHSEASLSFIIYMRIQADARPILRINSVQGSRTLSEICWDMLAHAEVVLMYFVGADAGMPVDNGSQIVRCWIGW